MTIAHCVIESTEGVHLSNFNGYQGIENHYYLSIPFDISCGSPAAGYSLTGDVPEGLVCKTPVSTSTQLEASNLGQLFPDKTALVNIIDDYTAKESVNYPFVNSDQGQLTLTPTESATLVTRTFNFTLVYNGISDGSPCTSSLPLTLFVLLDWSYQSQDSLIEIQRRVDNPNL